MTKQVSTSPIELHSGRRWSVWVNALDDRGARTMQHPQIAKLTMEFINAGWWNVKDQPNTGWWAQNVAIAYEQHVGIRKAGQQSDGEYAATVSKTFDGVAREVFDRWCIAASDLETSDFRTSETPRRLFWRTTTTSGTKIEVAFEQKSEDRVLVSVSESKIGDQSDVNVKKDFWRTVLSRLDN